MAVTPDGESMITVFSDKEIRILNLETKVERVISEEQPITSLSISGDGKFFIVNLSCQEIHLWDLAGEWKQPLKFSGHRQSKYVIRSCFGGLDSSFIASGSEDSQVSTLFSTKTVVFWLLLTDIDLLFTGLHMESKEHKAA